MADKQRKIQIRKVASPEPMPAHEWQAAEEMLAKLIARAYAADHPELFPDKGEDGLHEREE